MLYCTNACRHFRDDGPKYPNSGICRVSTDPTDKRTHSSNSVCRVTCRKPELREVTEQGSLFGEEEA